MDVECPSCGELVAVPDTRVRGQLLCAHCGDIFTPAKPETNHGQPAFRPIKMFAEIFSQIRLAGAASLFLGALSILLLCLPWEYIAPAASGTGVIVGVCDLVAALVKRRAWLYPLSGIIVCTVALLLRLIPLLGG